MHVTIDFETRSLCDIKYGAYRYAEDPSTEVLCIGYAVGDQEPVVWHPPHPFPSDLIDLARDPEARFWAFNIGFERRIWTHVLHRRKGLPDIPLNRWYDIQADAYSCGLPGDLERCARALGLEGKDPRGKKLISKLCTPIPNTNRFREPEDFPEDFQDFYEYCRQDVRTEWDAFLEIPHNTTAGGFERAVFQHTEEMNDAGVPLDRTFVENMVLIMEQKIEDANTRAARLTAGEIYSGTQVGLITESLHLKLPNLQKETVAAALRGTLDDHDRILLECRRTNSHTSTAKYSFMEKAICSDGTVKDNLQYHGAATGRLAGRGLQIQNLPRKTAKVPSGIVEAVCDPRMQYETIELIYGDLMELGVSMVRPSILAPEGKRFTCADYSQIESRARAWATGDEGQIASFLRGEDIYKVTAADMYRKPYEEVNEDDERQGGKVADLACGYQGGWKAVKDFATGYGIIMTNMQADRIVRSFRAARPRLVEAWENFGAAAIQSVNLGRSVEVLGVKRARFGWQYPHLYMELPSNRKIWFPFATVEEVTKEYTTPDGEVREFTATNVMHYKINQQNQWVQRGLHGGSFFQSYIQALCRDILMQGQLNLKDDGWNLIMSVHDECVSLDDDSPEWSLDRFNHLLCQLPDWAAGFPIKASGWQGRRYRK